MPRRKIRNLERKELYKRFGKRLKELRQSLDMPDDELSNGKVSQERFAELMNVSYDSVRNWEQGFSMPDHENMVKLCEFFHCSMDYLYGRTDYDAFSVQLSEKALLCLMNRYTFDPYKTVLSDLIEDESLISILTHSATTKYGMISEMLSCVDFLGNERTKIVTPVDMRNADDYRIAEMIIGFIRRENRKFNPDDWLNITSETP